MERRRRALGLKKLGSTREEKISKTTSIPVELHSPSRTRSEANAIKDGKLCLSRQTGCNTPKRGSLKSPSNVTPHKTDSPGSPCPSPNVQSIFPRTLGSPEIEVSWDWGCSQVPKDMLPPRRTKRLTQSQPSPSIASVVMPSRLPPDRQISEEENQERLAFYKNVLSKSLKRVTEDISVDSENNNLEKEIGPVLTATTTTPKRPVRSRVESSKKQEQVNSFFDDSANELMFECSQAIEEKLKSGEIGMGPIVSVKIPNTKHAHSPITEPENSHKKLCHGKTKLNLFPEVSNSIEIRAKNGFGQIRNMCLKSPRNKPLKTRSCIENKTPLDFSTENDKLENDEDMFFMRPTQVNQKLISNKTFANGVTSLNNNLNASQNNIKTVPTTNDLTKLQTNVNDCIDVAPSKSVCNAVKMTNGETLNMSEDVVLKKQGLYINNNSVNNKNHTSAENIIVGQVQSGNSANKINQNLLKPAKCCDIMNTCSAMTNPVLKQTSTVDQVNNVKSLHRNLTNKLEDTKSTTADFTSLLDDGFDMELSSLDFDSLCCNSQPKETQIQSVMKTPPKICSQQEIEAKRIAALNRLKMKKRR